MGRDVNEPRGHEQPNSAYQRAKSAMNRGHSLAASAASDSLDVAIAAYSKAIQILDTLPRTSETANSLGAALSNRGQLRHQLHGLAQADLALGDFQRAANLLEKLDAPGFPWPRRNRVGSLINQANLLLDLEQHPAALQAANTAIEANRFERLADPTDTELAVLAARAYCDAAGQLLPTLPAHEQEPLAQQAGFHLQTALVHIRALRPYLNQEPFAEASKRLFHFGCLLFATHCPENLPALIVSHFQNLQDESIRIHLIETAREAIKSAITQISLAARNAGTTPQEQDQLAALSQQLGELHQELPTL
ncbi:hypothetical protein [Pelagicoccus sp. SDUM812005]|uniref:hypothetical protein n=1 Tax=Pelagicoccus sp. SDUM812005 TaxID=3041257 RepID=UPI00280CF56B|nr:hypothetical protein [Pelagicoccus sp. SDUM812005]MDQ8181199.1 hypothetical protein [Pelagicoccus sp. SDUM812005]